MRHITALVLLVGLTTASCRPQPPAGPQRLLLMKTEAGALPRTGALVTGGETRAALLASARWRVALPARALLTFAYGVAWAGKDDAPGWLTLTVKADERTLFERKVNPRVAHGWRDVSVPLDGLGAETTLSFDLALADRYGKPVPVPPELMLGVGEPIVHDLAAYGRARGIVLVSIDTLRRDHVGAYGYAKPTTPRLDGLAARGILMDDAVSTSSWTLPAHLSMLTSADPGAHGGVDMEHGFNGRVPALPEVLKGAGFATQAVTSHLYVSKVYGLDRGFDHLDFRQDRKADEVAEAATAILDRLGDAPFFVFLHFYDPHWHYDPPERTRRLFETGYTGALSGNWTDFSKKDRAHVTDADLQHLLALYDGEIRYTDDALGRVLDHLRLRGLDASTLVVVTSDHGEEFLDHGSWEHQKTLYEEVIRIPLVVSGPGVAARKEPRQTSLLDVAPTVLAWAGLKPPPSMQGRSLLAPLTTDVEAYGETDHTIDRTHALFLRGGAARWKAILSLDPSAQKAAREQWYDLAPDPRELKSALPRDAAAESIRKRAIDRWRAARGRGGAGTAVTLSAEERERLRALGYVMP